MLIIECNFGHIEINHNFLGTIPDGIIIQLLISSTNVLYNAIQI
jgi:hypothetical protein